MSKLDRLGGALREVEAPLGRALKEKRGYTQWLDADLQLTYSQCGIATAALQRYLEQNQLPTTRLHQKVDVDVGNHGYLSDEHVVLVSDDGRVIDPTYTQFYGCVGLSSQLAQQFPDMRALFPVAKIGVFKTVDQVEFSQSIADHALAIRPVVTEALAARILEFNHSSPSLLETAPQETARRLYRQLWKMGRYREFTVADQVKRSTDYSDVIDDVMGRLA